MNWLLSTLGTMMGALSIYKAFLSGFAFMKSETVEDQKERQKLRRGTTWLILQSILYFCVGAFLFANLKM